jgi:hypothetical protein
LPLPCLPCRSKSAEAVALIYGTRGRQNEAEGGESNEVAMRPEAPEPVRSSEKSCNYTLLN